MQQGYFKCESNKNNSVCDIAQWKVSLLSKRLKNKLQLVLAWHIWQITHKKRMCALSLAKTKQPTQISGRKALKRVSASFELFCDDLMTSLVYDAPMLWPHNFSDSFIGSSLSIFHASNASPVLQHVQAPHRGACTAQYDFLHKTETPDQALCNFRKPGAQHPR